MTDGSSRGSITFQDQKRQPEGDNVKNQFQCLTRESPCEQSRGHSMRRASSQTVVLRPLDCFASLSMTDRESSIRVSPPELRDSYKGITSRFQRDDRISSIRSRSNISKPLR